MQKLKYKLEELIDVDNVSQMFELLYGVAKIPNALIDMEGKVLAGAGWQPICTDFHRKAPASEAVCIESDIHISEEIADGKPHCIYECPLGLVDSTCPVVVDGHHIGNVFTGQMLHTPLTEETRDRFRAQAEQYGYDKEAYMEALERVPVFPIEKHEEILKLLANIAEQLASSALIKLDAIKQAQELEESEALKRIAFNSLDLAMHVVDADLNIQMGNKKLIDWTNLLGYDSDILGKYLPDIFPFLTTEIIDQYHEVLESGISITTEETNSFNGQLLSTETTKTPMKSGDKITGVITVIDDITERKQDEQTLHQNESIISNTSEHMALIDNNYVYQAVNRAYLDAFKVTRAEIINHSVEDILGSEVFNHLVKDKLDCCLAGEDIRYQDWFDFPGIKGRRYMDVAYNTYKDTEGTVVGVVVTSRDSTDINLAEEEQNILATKLRESHTNFQSVLENTTDIILSVDKNYNLLTINSYGKKEFKRIIGYEPQIGKNMLDPLPDPMQPLWKERYDRALVGERYTVEDSFEDIYYSEVSFNPIHDGDLITGVAVFSRDITDRKRAEEDKLHFEKQILHTQKLESLGVLAGGIAHDFNNILMGILGYADLALADLDPIHPVREFVLGINDSTRKAVGLVKQMLAYSGKGKFSLEPIDLNHLIDDTTKMLEISISKNAILKFNYSKSSVSIEGDPSQIRQIIMNLVINASEAVGKRSGVIALTTGSMYCDREYIDSTGFVTQIVHTEQIKEGMYSFVEVSDTGIGMSKETIARIFEPFFTTKFIGRGLGLSAVLGIVKGHSGIVKIYSEEGKGTTFKVLFPLFESPENLSVLGGINSIDKDWQGQGTFLIADDEEAVRTVGKHMITRLGFDVLTAEHGREAIEIFEKHKDEIVGVLLDLTMPHKDGAEVFREIQKLNKATKVILTSGYNEQDATQQFVGKGLAGFIQKPYVAKELMEKIIEVMDKT